MSIEPETLVHDWIARIEAKAAGGGVNIYRALDLADIRQPTWSRWKNNILKPRAEDLFRLEAVVDEALLKKTEAAA